MTQIELLREEIRLLRERIILLEMRQQSTPRPPAHQPGPGYPFTPSPTIWPQVFPWHGPIYEITS